MAVQQGYGKLAGTDALVFAYDRDDARNSYKGAPTVNLLEQPGASSLPSRSDIYNNVTKTDLGNGKYRFVNDGTGGTTVRVYVTATDFEPDAIYTCSVSYEDFQPGDGNSLTLDWCDRGNQSFSLSQYGSANRVSITTFREANPHIPGFFDISIAPNASVVLFDAQVEKLSYATPYTNNERPSTESLYNLVNSQPIDLVNTSFDGQGNFTFDGIADYIDCGDIVSGKVTFSAESWVKTTDTRVGANSSYKNPSIFGTQHGSGASGDFALCVMNGTLGYYAELGSTGYRDSGVFVADDLWHHLAVTKDSSGVIKLYVDGVEVYSRTGNTGTLRTTDLQQYHWEVGRAYWRGEDSTMLRFNGDIATHRFYDRALSASEILNNYNNQKTKYNLL